MTSKKAPMQPAYELTDYILSRDAKGNRSAHCLPCPNTLFGCESRFLYHMSHVHRLRVDVSSFDKATPWLNSHPSIRTSGGADRDAEVLDRSGRQRESLSCQWDRLRGNIPARWRSTKTRKKKEIRERLCKAEIQSAAEVGIAEPTPKAKAPLLLRFLKRCVLKKWCYLTEEKTFKKLEQAIRDCQNTLQMEDWCRVAQKWSERDKSDLKAAQITGDMQDMLFLFPRKAVNDEILHDYGFLQGRARFIKRALSYLITKRNEEVKKGRGSLRNFSKAVAGYRKWKKQLKTVSVARASDNLWSQYLADGLSKKEAYEKGRFEDALNDTSDEEGYVPQLESWGVYRKQKQYTDETEEAPEVAVKKEATPKKVETTTPKKVGTGRGKREVNAEEAAHYEAPPGDEGEEDPYLNHDESDNYRELKDDEVQEISPDIQQQPSCHGIATRSRARVAEQKKAAKVISEKRKGRLPADEGTPSKRTRLRLRQVSTEAPTNAAENLHDYDDPQAANLDGSTEEAAKTSEGANNTTEEAAKTSEGANNTTEEAAKTSEEANNTSEEAAKTSEEANNTTEEAKKTTEEAVNSSEEAHCDGSTEDPVNIDDTSAKGDDFVKFNAGGIDDGFGDGFGVFDDSIAGSKGAMQTDEPTAARVVSEGGMRTRVLIAAAAAGTKGAIQCVLSDINDGAGYGGPSRYNLESAQTECMEPFVYDDEEPVVPGTEANEFKIRTVNYLGPSSIVRPRIMSEQHRYDFLGAGQQPRRTFTPEITFSNRIPSAERCAHVDADDVHESHFGPYPMIRGGTRHSSFNWRPTAVTAALPSDLQEFLGRYGVQGGNQIAIWSQLQGMLRNLPSNAELSRPPDEM